MGGRQSLEEGLQPPAGLPVTHDRKTPVYPSSPVDKPVQSTDLRFIQPRVNQTIPDTTFHSKTKVTEPHSKATEPHSKVTEPHSKVTEPHSKVTEPHSKVSEAQCQGTTASTDKNTKLVGEYHQHSAAAGAKDIKPGDRQTNMPAQNGERKQKTENDRMRIMVPEAMAQPKSDTKKHQKHSRRNKPRWRKNYMMASMPARCTDAQILLSPGLKADSVGLTRSSSEPQGNQSRHHKHRRKKILKMFDKCAESMEGLASRVYVDSMTFSSEEAVTAWWGNLPVEENLISLDEKDYSNHLLGIEYRKDKKSSMLEKNFSEIIISSDDELQGGRPADMSSSEMLDRRQLFLNPKLRLGSFASSYVGSEESSYSESQEGDEVNRDDYVSLVVNGESTAFGAEDCEENNLSFYYDDEFDTERSPLGMAARDSDLEAAICHQYASLLDGQQVGDDSNFSSGFDNIFPASLTQSEDEGCIISTEEMPDLDVSVPNYAQLSAATRPDYHLTFTGGAGVSSVYSGGEKSQTEESKGEQNKVLTNPVPKPPRATVQTSAKKVSFSDELCELSEDDEELIKKIEEIENSTTWCAMKQNYTTWGQVKMKREEPKKSRSIPDLGMVQMREKRSEPVEDRKRYSLTLWEMYKRNHSMDLSVSMSEMKTPDAFIDSAERQELRESIDNLLDDALGSAKKKPTASKSLPPLPDVSFLKTNKNSLTEYKWWNEIFDQPTFCNNSKMSCSSCEKAPSNDHTVLVFQGDKGVNQQKICQMSLLNQLFPSSSCRGDCRTTSGLIREKFSTELSSGIATGSSGVTPREPNSWQHIADFLKRRQKHTDGNSRGSLNSTLSDQQLLDIVACIEAADVLCKGQSAPEDHKMSSQDVMLKVWKLVSALECILSLGLKSHKLVTVTMGKIRARVTLWDIVEESCKAGGEVTPSFSQILAQISAHRVDDISIRFCLFVVGLLNFQCLDFWLQLLQHNRLMMDKFYNDDSFLRSKISADRKLHAELIQSLQPLALYHWDINYSHMLEACNIPEQAPPVPPHQMKKLTPSATTAGNLHQAPQALPRHSLSLQNVRQARGQTRVMVVH